MRQLEVRRHAKRDPLADALSAEGRVQAQAVGAAHATDYAAVFVSPAQRAAETVAWFLRGGGRQLPPDHEVVPGLAGQGAGGGSPEDMASGLRALLDRVPDGARGLAVSHTPLVERGAFGLTGREIEPLRECEGILLTVDDHGALTLEELRLA